ncbi:Imm27 family immunity protein [Mesorhizobium sp. KR9-304]|uniref:Imm27 family immunity protein n=1 Tax=Mesorhizobium sp. KR9-304 TaxID=3156614 RepID=UPI0032B414DA
MIELKEVWVWRENRMIAEGHAKQIDELLAANLTEVAASSWHKLYRHKETGKLWELDYPQSELHGGGPRRLRELRIADADQWMPPSETQRPTR